MLSEEKEPSGSVLGPLNIHLKQAQTESMYLFQAVVKNSQPEPEDQMNHSPKVKLGSFRESGKQQQCREGEGTLLWGGRETRSECRKWGSGYSSFPWEGVAYKLRLTT